EAPLPEPVAEDDRARLTLLAVVGRERAAEQRLRAKHLEQPGRRELRWHLLGLAIARQRHRRVEERRERAERAALRLPVLEGSEVDDVRLAPLRGRNLPRHDEALRLAIRQRSKERRVDDAEDRRARADAQRERDNGDDGQAWLPDERAEADAQIGYEAAHG